VQSLKEDEKEQAEIAGRNIEATAVGELDLSVEEQ
jgi:hypothetical protein